MNRKQDPARAHGGPVGGEIGDKVRGGILRIHAECSTGRLVAAGLCAPAAEYLAHLLALAIEREMTVNDMRAKPFCHPVLEEGLRGALRDLAKGVASAGGSDLSDCRKIGHDALD